MGTYMVVLELDDVVESDAGLYKIKAKNTYGEVSASINLNFSRKLHLVLIHSMFCKVVNKSIQMNC